MTSFSSVKEGIKIFVESEMFPKLDSMTKVVMGSVIYIAEKKADTLFVEIKNNKIVKTLGLIDDNGNINLELTYDALKKGMNGAPISKDIIGLGMTTFTPEDLDKLYNMIKSKDVPEQTTLFDA